MSIKQSIAALVVLMSVSFSAFSSDVLTITTKGYKGDLALKCLGLSIGASISTSSPPSVSGKSVQYGYDYFECKSVSLDGTTLTVHAEERGGGSDLGQVHGTLSASCPNNQIINPETGVCEDPQYCSKPSTISAIESARSECESSGKQFSFTCSNETESWQSECNGENCDDVNGQSGDLTWDSSVYGNSAPSSHMCSSKGGGCSASIDESSAWCGESGWCYASFTVTGGSCGNSGGGDIFCSDPECSGVQPPGSGSDNDTNPIHTPDDPTGEIIDPSPLPDGSTGSVPPKETEPEPEVEDPLTDPDTDLNTTDKAVVQAITGMNTDINSALNNLNTDINDNAVNIQNELIGLNASVIQNSQTIQEQQKNDNKIYENTKALIQQANADITTAVNKNTNAINALGDDVEAIGEGVAGIRESLDGLANLDLSGSLNGTCPYNSESESCTGYYEVGYPNGFEGLVGDHFAQLESEVTGIVDGMFALDVSNGSAPSFCMEVMQFGRHCFTDYFDLAAVFAFIRACMMFGTVMLCRKLVFGG